MKRTPDISSGISALMVAVAVLIASSGVVAAGQSAGATEGRGDAAGLVAADPLVPTAVAAGGNHSCALVTGGRVKCWGWNGAGQLGDGTAGPFLRQSRPVSVSGLSGATAVAAGGFNSCAVVSPGRATSVKCWGYNFSGQVGDGTTTNRSTPVTVSGLTSPTGFNRVTGVSVGSNHSCAVLSLGSARCWGENAHGRLGDGTTTDRSTPVSVSGLSGVTAVAAGGDHSCALLSGGTVKCWGLNSEGQLGDGTTTTRLTPVSVSGLSGVTAVSVGSRHTCALLSGGTVKCWGRNFDGQLGDGTRTGRLTPVSVSGLSGATAVDTGTAHSCALVSGGTVRCWGNNLSGEVGDGSTTDRLTPVPVSGLSGATAVAAGKEHSCALGAGRMLRCWGFNAQGQLGEGTTTRRLTPVLVVGFGPSGTANEAFVQVAYADFLDRPPNSDELAFVTAILNNGSRSRGQVVGDLANSPERVTVLVQRLYQDTLGRPGDPGGVAYWVGELRSGRRTVANVAANFYASAEYYEGIGGGTDQSWVTDLYRKLLLREPDPGGLNYWVGQTAARGRVNVAFRFFQSEESGNTRVDNLYRELLGRPAEPAGIAYWTPQVLFAGDIVLAANLAASDEYFNRAQVN